MNTAGVSIIIPCYNTGHFVCDAVDSIARQHIKRASEIVVVDDGSTDSTTIRALKQVRSVPNLNVIRLPHNSGAQVARNTGILAAKHDYIFTVDSDDMLSFAPEVLANGTYADLAIDMLETSSEVAFVHGMAKMFGEFQGYTISAYPLTEKLLLKKHHAQISIVYRKEDAIAAGLYDKRIRKWQDWSFAVALLNGRLKAGKLNRIGFLPSAYYMYRIHSSPQRISASNIDECEMVKLTAKLYPEIFRQHYGVHNDDLMAQCVMQNKPDRLRDLLYIANHNIEVAIALCEQRQLQLAPFPMDGRIP